MAMALNKIPGIGPKSAAHLLAQGIDSAEALLAAGSAALLGAPGFHEGRANAVLEAAAGVVLAEEESAAAQAPVTDAQDEKKGKKGKKSKKKGKKDKGEKKAKRGKKEKKRGKKKRSKKKKGKKDKK